MLLQKNKNKNKIKEHILNWPRIPEHLYLILITCDSGLGKTNSLFNLIGPQPDIDNICLYAKGLYEVKY